MAVPKPPRNIVEVRPTLLLRRLGLQPGCLLCSDELEDKLFWPHAEAAMGSYDDRDREHFERDPYGERWPRCYGRCSGGMCKLDQSKPGCCYSRGGRHGYAQSTEAVEQVGPYALANLVCWDGDGAY
jgi:hypothetical protein